VLLTTYPLSSLSIHNGDGTIKVLSIKLSSYRVGRTVLPKCAISEHILWKYIQRRWKELGTAKASTSIREVPGSNLRQAVGNPALFSQSVQSTVTVT